MAALTVSRSLLAFGVASLLAGVVLLALLAPEVAAGLDSLTWPSAPATTITAYYHIEYDPVASHGMDGGVHRSWNGLRLAYTTPAGEHYVTCAFDTAGLRSRGEPFFRPLPVRVEHVIDQGDQPRVFFDPDAPARAVVQPGIPFTTGVALFLPAWLLAAGVLALRKKSGTPFGAGLAALIVVFVFFLIFALGISPLWSALTGAAPPWWFVPSIALQVFATALVPTLFADRISAATLAICVLLMPVAGVVGLIANEREPFGLALSDQAQLERLEHSHPAVAEYAVYHFVNDPIPVEALAPLRRLVAEGETVECRWISAVALGRMGADALPALPDLEIAATAPENSAFRDGFESAVRTLTNFRDSREPSETD